MASTSRPIAFVLAATNHGTMLVNRHDYRLIEGGGYGVGYQLFNSSSFDASEVDLVLQLLLKRRTYFGDGVLAIDCGANIGVHTIEWAKSMQTWGEVLAFEAQERIFYALAGNITLNNCFNARAIWAAVGESEGLIGVPKLDYFEPASFGSLELRQRSQTEFIGQSVNYSSEEATTVKLLSIDSLNLNRLDFLKIDIEGMEIEALRGAQRSINQFNPIILVEKIKSNEVDLSNLLKERKYAVFDVGLNLLAISENDPTLKDVHK